MAVTVLLVDDVDELRAVVRQAIRLRGGLEVVAEAGDGAGAIAAARQHRPDVIVLDLGLPDLAGREVLTRLREVSPSSQVIVFTGSFTHDREEVMRAADAYVQKDEQIGYLIDLLDDLGRRRHRTATRQVGADRNEVAAARRFVVDHCVAWGCEDVADDARVVASELVTNALVHAATTCEVRVRLAAGILRIEVTDGGAGIPDPRMADRDDESGRGLLLVSALCTAWGVEALTGGGKLVWAELPCVVHPGAEPPGPSSAAAPGPGRSNRSGGPGDRAPDTGDRPARAESPSAGRLRATALVTPSGGARPAGGCRGARRRRRACPVG